MFQNLKKKHWVLFFILIPVVGAYIVGLFIDLTRDGAKYAYISKEIAEGGSWLNLQIQGQLYTQKPQFLFWLSAASFVLLGISNFAFKLPILLYSILGLYAVYRLGKALYDKKTGQIAALMLLFSVISVLYNMDIHTDIVLQTNVALALWMLYEYLLQPKINGWLVRGLASDWLC
jgi:4-amino-4-deoxy-L-arabinose transferase-like glycosyltransferase